MIDAGAIERVKRSIDLAAIVRAHGVELKRKGKQLVGRCPFHSPDRTPSFFVDPAMGTWKCFGACASKGDEKSGGDAIRFVMKADKLSFRAAIEKLGGPVEAKPLAGRSKAKSNGNGDLALLARVVDFYARTLQSSPAAQQYLASRGLANAELWSAYRIGYADGSLLAKAKGTTADALARLGIINDAGRELMHGCVVFPLVDRAGAVVDLYGRAIERDQHLYLAGPKRGLFNAETLRGAEEVILTESVIDALSCIEAGVMNVLPLYGTNGFTDEHAKLLAELQASRVALALDSDDAGRAATAKLARELAQAGDVRVVELARKDLNDVLVHDGIDALKRALAGERIDSPTSPENRAAEEKNVVINGSELRYVSGARTYVVRGIESKRGGSLRVGLKLSVGEARVIDAVDLYSARSRNGFLSRVVEAQLGDRIDVERDLMLLLDTIERHQARRDEPAPAPSLEMTSDERSEAMALLRRADLLDAIAADMEAAGYVGEATNKQLGYLVAVSRKLSAPLSMIITSQSGSGKSALADTLELLMPPEEMILFSRLSAQALYYMERDALQHKFIVVEERTGSMEADYSIRSLQSKKKLILAVPIKDPSSGRIKTQVFEILGPAAFLETTTETRIHPENATRCFEVWCDESAEQTKRIHEAQRRSKTAEGRAAAREREAIIRRHQNAQRLLETIDVVIPFAGAIAFPHQWLRTRRDHLRFLNLIEVIAFLHQHQRQRKTDGDGRTYIDATIDDYERAYVLAADVLGATLADLKKPAAELLGAMRALVAKKPDSSITRRELREATGLPDHRVAALLHELVQLEYAEVLCGSQGQRFRYRLTPSNDASSPALAGLATPDELRARLVGVAATSKLRKRA
ncbi:MAG TPA: CHC2 zinc finger domain-containing protein [Thermoanaerobaculia bacterium]|nr:CHC2 zinc finger domain-containing protein [Thermoanaerobaculia bacterium]